MDGSCRVPGDCDILWMLRVMWSKGSAEETETPSACCRVYQWIGVSLRPGSATRLAICNLWCSHVPYLAQSSHYRSRPYWNCQRFLASVARFWNPLIICFIPWGDSGICWSLSHIGWNKGTHPMLLFLSLKCIYEFRHCCRSLAEYKQIMMLYAPLKASRKCGWHLLDTHRYYRCISHEQVNAETVSLADKVCASLLAAPWWLCRRNCELQEVMDLWEGH